MPAEIFSRRDKKVITMEMIGKVRRMKLREQLSNSEIARRTGLSRNTIKKWLQAPGDQAPKYQRGNGPTKLGAFEETLVQALQADMRGAPNITGVQPGRCLRSCRPRATGAAIAD